MNDFLFWFVSGLAVFAVLIFIYGAIDFKFEQSL